MALFKVTIKGHGAGDGPDGGAAALDPERVGQLLEERHRVEASGHRKALDEVWAEYEREHPEHPEPHHATVFSMDEEGAGLSFLFLDGSWNDERSAWSGRGRFLKG